MKMFDKKVSLGLIIASREFFNGTLALDARRDVIAQLDKLGIGYHILPVAATNNGTVETKEDVRKYVQLFDEHRHDIDGFVVLLPNFGDEIAVIETIQRSRLKVPILVQACNDDIDKVDLRGRRDAFCGKLSVCNNLYQYGIDFTDTTTHTSDIASDEFAADLDRFARVCRTVKGLKNARIGSIGAKPEVWARAAVAAQRFWTDAQQADLPVPIPRAFRELFRELRELMAQMGVRRLNDQIGRAHV